MQARILSSIVFIAFLAVAGILLLSRFSVPGFDFKLLVVQSGSMEPAIKQGSLIFVSPSSLYREGDIITFRRTGSTFDIPVTHRITAVEVISGEYAYVVKGDANKYEDSEKVLITEVIGKVAFSVPYLGILVDKAKTPLGFAFLVVFPALLIVSGELKKIYVEIKKGKNE